MCRYCKALLLAHFGFWLLALRAPGARHGARGLGSARVPRCSASARPPLAAGGWYKHLGEGLPVLGVRFGSIAVSKSARACLALALAPALVVGNHADRKRLPCREAAAAVAITYIAQVLAQKRMGTAMAAWS
jgi:hypothetical protein